MSSRAPGAFHAFKAGGGTKPARGGASGVVAPGELAAGAAAARPYWRREAPAAPAPERAVGGAAAVEGAVQAQKHQPLPPTGGAEAHGLPFSVGADCEQESPLTEMLRRAKPTWTEMELVDTESKLLDVGITSVEALKEALSEHLNGRLRKAGFKAFKPSTIRELKYALGVHANQHDPCPAKHVPTEPLVPPEGRVLNVGLQMGKTPTVYIRLSDIDTEIISVEGMINQVDIDENYDADWRNAMAKHDREDDSNESSSSEGDAPTREGLINQVDIDEDYDADWKYAVDGCYPPRHRDLGKEADRDLDREEASADTSASAQDQSERQDNADPAEVADSEPDDDRPIPNLDELLQHLDQEDQKEEEEEEDEAEVPPVSKEGESEERVGAEAPRSPAPDVVELERQARERLLQRLQAGEEAARERLEAERQEESLREERRRVAEAAELAAAAHRAAVEESQRLAHLTLRIPFHSPGRQAVQPPGRGEAEGEGGEAPEAPARRQPVEVVLGLRVKHTSFERTGVVVELPFGEPPFFLVRFEDGVIRARKVDLFQTETGRPLLVPLRPLSRARSGSTWCALCRSCQALSTRDAEGRQYCAECWRQWM